MKLDMWVVYQVAGVSLAILCITQGAYAQAIGICAAAVLFPRYLRDKI